MKKFPNTHAYAHRREDVLHPLLHLGHPLVFRRIHMARLPLDVAAVAAVAVAARGSVVVRVGAFRYNTIACVNGVLIPIWLGKKRGCLGRV